MSAPDKDASQRADAERRALLLDADLFFSVKVTAMLKHIGMATVTARKTADWNQRLRTERFDITLVNTAAQGIDWREAIVEARKAGLPVIAYGSHVDIETQAEARDAGATRVIANSKLAADLPSIIEQTLRRMQGAADRAATESGSDARPDLDTQDDDA